MIRSGYNYLDNEGWVRVSFDKCVQYRLERPTTRFKQEAKDKSIRECLLAIMNECQKELSKLPE